ncbi:MAG: glycosyltransferase, partial [Paracoccaceae bacterium]|nr:glycosyltransferase [Paracoccaceae bacterium]
QIFEPDLGRFLREQLRDLRIDVVLFHHLMHFPVHLLAIPELYGVRTVAVWHDFFLICPSFNLLNEAGSYCEIDRLPAAECIPCSARQFGWPATAMPARRRFVRDCLARIDLHVFSTPESRRIAQEIYAIDEARTMVCPVPARLPAKSTAGTSTRDMSKVLLLGNFSRNKGSTLLKALVKPLVEAGFGLRVAGRVDVNSTEELAGPIEVIGPYSREDLGKVAGDCGLALFLSVWPETFSITLSEVRQLGLTPVAPALGAFRDRIDPGRNGWLFDRPSPEAVLAALEAARRAGPVVSDEVPLSAQDYADRIAAALPAPEPEALRLRDSPWICDVPFDMQSFSVTRPIYYLPGGAPGAGPEVVVQTRRLVSKAIDYYRRHGLRPTLERIGLYFRERRLRNR